MASVRFDYFQNRSVKFVTENLRYSRRKFKFTNFISDDEDLIKKYVKEIKRQFLMLKTHKTLESLKITINNKKNWDIIDSNQSIELIVKVFEKYGFKRRYILSEIINGSDSITYVNNQGVEEYVPAKLVSDEIIFFKIPIAVIYKSDVINKMRIIILAKIIDNELILFPLFFDPYHLIFTSRDLPYYEDINNNFSKVVSNHFMLFGVDLR